MNTVLKPLKFSLILILNLTCLAGQVQVLPMGKGALKGAFLLEQKGELEAARKVYESVLAANPKDRQTYSRLKNVLLRMSDHQAAVELIQKWLELFPNDLREQIDLGEVFYRMESEDRARSIWRAIEKNYNKSPHVYQMLFQIYSSLSLTDDAGQLIQRGRDQLGVSDFMSMELGHYFYARRTFDRALDEFLIHLTHHPRQEKFIQDRILLMSDEEETREIIEEKLNQYLNTNEVLIRKLLAGYFFKLRQFDKAYGQHKHLGFKNSKDVDRFLALAGNLRLEREYELSMTVYRNILEAGEMNPSLLTPENLGAALLGMGQTYEDQIVVRSRRPQYVAYFPDNIFFEDHFHGQPDISTASLESTFELYHRILKQNPNTGISPQIHVRLAEIQYQFTRDFDGARASFYSALNSKPKEGLNQHIYLRFGDLYLAEGKIDEFLKFVKHKVPENYKTRPANIFTLRKIQAHFLAGSIDSSKTLIDSILTALKPTDLHFNDLMELSDILSLYDENNSIADSSAFRQYTDAEYLIRQSKLTEATERLAFLRTQFPGAVITGHATLREALLRYSLGDSEGTLELSEQLLGTSLGDRGLALKGETLERLNQNPKSALKIYHQLLEDYPRSMLAEPIRRHLRKLNQSLES